MWPDWFKVIQLKPRFLFGIWLLGLMLLFLPSYFASRLGITTFREQHRSWIGLATMAAFVFWLVQMIPSIRRSRESRRYRAEVIKHLGGLTPQERFLLAFCVSAGQRTIYMKLSDASAQSLCDKGLLEKATGTGSMLAWPYSVPSFVWDYLRANRDSLLREADWKSVEFQEACKRFEHEMHSRFY